MEKRERTRIENLFEKIMMEIIMLYHEYTKVKEIVSQEKKNILKLNSRLFKPAYLLGGPGYCFFKLPWWF